jgi:D-alanyl-lipoteichoic acid acyltransferase DltB (MBOAT superfamily)
LVTLAYQPNELAAITFSLRSAAPRAALVRYRNIMLTVVLCGLWHGAAWTFVVFGALHGAALVFHHVDDWRESFTCRKRGRVDAVATFLDLPHAGCFRSLDLERAGVTLRSVILFTDRR